MHSCKGTDSTDFSNVSAGRSHSRSFRQQTFQGILYTRPRTVPGAGDAVRNHHPPVQSLLFADRSLSSPKRGEDLLEVTQQVHLRAGLERRAPGTLNSADYASAVVRFPQVT